MDITREMLTGMPIETIWASEAKANGVTQKSRRLTVFLDLKTNAVWFTVNGKRHDWLSDAIDAYNAIDMRLHS